MAKIKIARKRWLVENFLSEVPINWSMVKKSSRQGTPVCGKASGSGKVQKELDSFYGKFVIKALWLMRPDKEEIWVWLTTIGAPIT